jgi:hypothetical protein
MNRKRLAAVLTAAALGVGQLVGMAGGAQAADDGVIASNGPLAQIRTTPDLNCAVSHISDDSPEFYGETACGTLVALGGTLYGPAYIPAGGSASPLTAFTPVSQVGPTGTGTAADPYRVVTTVGLGDSGVRLEQTDVYVAGQENYDTTVELHNNGEAAAQAIVYRAGDCYLANSDYGLGSHGEDWVACVSESNRVEQWVPLTSGSTFFEADYDQVWSWIGSQRMFPDTCRCAENIDNGAGLSWTVNVPAGGTARVAHKTAFAAAEEALDTDGDGLLDLWETDGLDVDGDGTPELDLAAMGATPDHKDLFVEVDWMVAERSCFLFVCWGSNLNFAPQQDALDDVVASFAAAPVSNPDGRPGVRLHVDNGPDSVMNAVTGDTWGSRSRGNAVGHVQRLGSFTSSGAYDWSDYDAIKSANFDTARADVFHYAIYGDTYSSSGSSGIARGIPQDSFLVTDGGWNGTAGFSIRQEAGTFMHEFGHTLGLHHGGGGSDDGRDVNFKPNYLSIMNYAWQLQGRDVDYSRSQLASLDETLLDEEAGLATGGQDVRRVCPTGAARVTAAGADLDWDCDGDIDEVPVMVNINGDRDGNNDNIFSILRGYDDWPNVDYDGGAVGAFGASDLDDQAPPPRFTPADEASIQEFKDAGVYGEDGDGALDLVGPLTLLRGATGQSIAIDVVKVGKVAAGYRVTLHSDLAGVDGKSVDVTVDADATRRVTVPVTAESLSGSTFSVSAELTAAGGTEVLARDSMDGTIPSADTVTQQAADVLAHLATPRPGLDEGLRSALVAALEQVAPSEQDTLPTVSLPGVVDGVVGDSHYLVPRLTQAPGASGGVLTDLSLDGTRISLARPIDLTAVPLGEHTLVATVRDSSGRTADRTVTFESVTTYDDVAAIIGRYASARTISASTAAGLGDRLARAQQAAAAGQDTRAVSYLDQFLDRVRSQVKQAGPRSVLLRDGQALRDALS